jgi:hypothetical protein
LEFERPRLKSSYTQIGQIADRYDVDRLFGQIRDPPDREA